MVPCSEVKIFPACGNQFVLSSAEHQAEWEIGSPISLVSCSRGVHPGNLLATKPSRFSSRKSLMRWAGFRRSRAAYRAQWLNIVLVRTATLLLSYNPRSRLIRLLHGDDFIGSNVAQPASAERRDEWAFIRRSSSRNYFLVLLGVFLDIPAREFREGQFTILPFSLRCRIPSGRHGGFHCQRLIASLHYADRGELAERDSAHTPLDSAFPNEALGAVRRARKANPVSSFVANENLRRCRGHDLSTSALVIFERCVFHVGIV